MKKGIPSIPSTDPEFQIHTDILNVTSKDWADDMFLNYKRNNSSSSALSPRRTSVDDSENHMMMWKSYSIDDSVLNKTNIPTFIPPPKALTSFHPSNQPNNSNNSGPLKLPLGTSNDSFPRPTSVPMNGSLHKSLKATQDANLDVKDRPVVKDSINLDTGEFMDFLAASSHDFYEALRSTGVKRKGSADAYDVSLPNSPRFGDDGAIAKTTSLDILTNVSSLKYDEVRESPQRILSNRQFQNQRMTEFEEPVLSPPRFNTKNVANQKLGYGSIQGLPSFDFHDSFFTTAVNTNFHGIAPADKQQKRDSFASYAGSEGDSDKNFRGKYKCGRCGQPKVNHNCEFVAEADVISTGTQCSFDSPQPHEKFLTVIRRKSIFEALPRSNGEDISRSISSGYVGLGYGVTPLFLGQNSKAMQDFQSNHIDKLSEVDEKRQEEFRISSNKEIPKSPLSVSNSDKIGKKNSQKSNMDPKNEKFSEEEEIIINILASSSTDYYDDNGGSASREFK